MTTATATPERAAEPGVPFERLLRVEWEKTKDTRAAQWLKLITGLLIVAFVVIGVLVPGDIDQNLQSYHELAGWGTAILLPVVAILQMTSEWSTRTVMVTFTQEPRRARVLAAKLVTGLAMGALFALFAHMAALAGLGVSALLGRDVGWSDGPIGLGMLAFVLLNVLMASAFGAALQNSAAAIVVFYVLPTVFSLLAFGFFEDVGEWLDTSQTLSWLIENDMGGHWLKLGVSLLVWIAIPLTVGVWRTLRREVK